MKSYFLMTGASGLLGSYLMRDGLQAGLRLAVLARRSRMESATARIETILARWEKQLGYVLPRPVVLEGDICQEHLGLSAEAQQWVQAHCHSLIHSAASLSFEVDPKTNEPWRSNLEGTQHVIALARRVGIRQFHQVSTAYVCGLRTGRILESDVNVGQTLGNVYEQSKLQSEQLVRESDAFDQVTVHRPAIIVGDAYTGYTTTYHGFYTPLKVVHSLVGKVPPEEIQIALLLQSLGLTGQERKNFVPVDWVSAVMTHVLAHPELHGKTYHLTPRTRVSVAEMTSEFELAIRDFSYKQVEKRSAAPIDGPAFEDIFRTQLQTYQSYWRDDPEFDQTNTLAAAPHLPCPIVDAAMMRTLCQYAIESNFGWPLPAPLPAPFSLHDYLQQQVSTFLSAADAAADEVGLQVTGPGGGEWTLRWQGEQLQAILPGASDEAVPHIYLSSPTFQRLLAGQTTAADALRAGRVVLRGEATKVHELLERLQLVCGAGQLAK